MKSQISNPKPKQESPMKLPIKFLNPPPNDLRIPIHHRAILSMSSVNCRVLVKPEEDYDRNIRDKNLGNRPRPKPRNTEHATRLLALLLLSTLNYHLSTAATVTGTLNDISIQALDTKLIFTPTNDVLVTPTGL